MLGIMASTHPAAIEHETRIAAHEAAHRLLRIAWRAHTTTNFMDFLYSHWDVRHARMYAGIALSPNA